ERSAVRTLGALGQERGNGAIGLRGPQIGDEFLDHVFGMCTDETVDDLAVAKCVHRRDRLDLEGLRDTGVLVDVDLDQHHFAVGGVGDLFEDRADRATRPAPRSPQIHHHCSGVGALDYLGLERCVGDIDGHERTIPGYRTSSMNDVPGIDIAPVTEWLEGHVPGARGPFSFEVIAGGHSNLTYRVVGADGAALVLRRPPLGHRLSSAHDMGREHRVIAALQQSAVPVAPALGLCTDDTVNGAPFYVMGFVDGHVVRDRVIAEQSLSLPARRRAGDSLVETMAAIHAVDLEAVGLADLGKHDGYIARQLKRWYGQWNDQKTRDVRAIDDVFEALNQRIPEQGPATLV